MNVDNLARRAAPRPARALPDDPTIALLSAPERRIAAAIWHGRAESELRAAGSFTVIARTLEAAGAPPELVAIARRAIADERQHAAICAHVAATYALDPLPPVRTLALRVPIHPGASPALQRVLHVVGQSCLNETTGSAFLEGCLARSTAPLASAALRQLLADEIDHARIGWAFLAMVDDAMRTQVAAWIPTMIAANLRAWRDRPHHAITDRLVEHGCPRWEDVDAVVVAAIDDLVRPGLAHVGVVAT
ncbi:MAG: hypothetical protein NT062_08770 [Proteobacteria bacterium]|nr:hypothetical protein [Pseudomonadota bacterium]